MKVLVSYLALVLTLVTSLVFSRPTGSRNEQRKSDLDDNEEEECGELVPESEVNRPSPDFCLIFEDRLPSMEVRKILLQALEVINDGPTTPKRSSQRVKDSQERALARKVLSAMNIQEHHSIDCETVPVSSMADVDFSFEYDATSRTRR